MTRQGSRSAAVTLLIVVLAACSGTQPTASPTTAPTVAPTTAPTVAPTTPPTEAPTEPPTEAPTEPPTEVPISDVAIQLDFVLSGSFAPLLWGDDKGFFESRGINPDFIPGEGTDDALGQINGGNVDFAFVDGSNYIEQRITGDTPTTAVYVWFPISTTGIISLEELSEPEDMAGKTFGTVPFSSGKDKIPAVLQANGVDYPGPDDPNTLVELMDFGVLYPTLFSGDIFSAEAGLAGSWESARASAEEQGLTVYFKPISDWGYKDYSKLLIARDDIIESDPDLVGRVVAAIWESETDALANASADDLYQLLLAVDPQAEEGRTGATWESFQTYMLNPGPIDPSVFQYQLDFLASQGTTTDLTAEDLYTNEFIPD